LPRPGGPPTGATGSGGLPGIAGPPACALSPGAARKSSVPMSSMSRNSSPHPAHIDTCAATPAASGSGRLPAAKLINVAASGCRLIVLI
jgi:hypothetical protein